MDGKLRGRFRLNSVFRRIQFIRFHGKKERPKKFFKSIGITHGTFDRIVNNTGYFSKRMRLALHPVAFTKFIEINHSPKTETVLVRNRTSEYRSKAGYC